MGTQIDLEEMISDVEKENKKENLETFYKYRGKNVRISETRRLRLVGVTTIKNTLIGVIIEDGLSGFNTFNGCDFLLNYTPKPKDRFQYVTLRQIKKYWSGIKE